MDQYWKESRDCQNTVQQHHQRTSEPGSLTNIATSPTEINFAPEADAMYDLFHTAG